MIVAFLQGAVPRLIVVGMIAVALQTTLFVELRPFGITVQLVLALAAACGAVGGAQKGALAGFVLGLMFDLRAGTPIGSSSLAFGLGGFLAGSSLSITVDPTWWLAGLFTGLGAAIGEILAPVVRAFIGEPDPFRRRWYVAVIVVTVGAMLLSPLLLPVARFAVRVKRTDWSKAAVGKADVAS